MQAAIAETNLRSTRKIGERQVLR